MSDETVVTAPGVMDPKVYEWMVAFLGGIDQVRAGMDFDRLLIERTTEFESFTDGTVLERFGFEATLLDGVWVYKYGGQLNRTDVLVEYAAGRLSIRVP